MRIRTWIFAAVVALVLAINLVLVSLRIAQTGEETVRARVAQASAALKAQLELLDVRVSPRAAAMSPDLIEATRPPVDPTQPLGKPDERALRAAAATLQPEPDLLIVASAQGAIVSRRGKPAVQLDDVSALPLVKAGLETNLAPAFAPFEGSVYRAAAARIPGNAAVVVVGTLVDDRFAAQLRSQVDGEVTLLQGGKVVASSLQPDERTRLVAWSKSPGSGYGVLPVRLPLVGTRLSGKLPRGTARLAVRGALLPLDGGVQAAVTVPASPYLGWLARYQAFYLFALLLFVLFGLLWGLMGRAPPAPATAPEAAQRPRVSPAVRAKAASLAGTDVSPGPTSQAERPAPAPSEVPWASGEEPVAEPARRPVESLDPAVPPPLREEPSAPLSTAAKDLPVGEPRNSDSLWSADPLTGSSFPAPHLMVAELAAPEATVGDAVVAAHQDAAVDPHEEAAGGASDAESAPAALPPQDFSFAGLLDEAHSSATSAPPADPTPPPALSQDYPDRTSPGKPTPELLEHARGGFETSNGAPEKEYFPGDEPTRIEPVSAALLDKLREKDEEMSAAAAAARPEPLPESAIDPGPAAAVGEGAHQAHEEWGAQQPVAEAAPAEEVTQRSARREMPVPGETQPSFGAEYPRDVTMTDFSMPVVSDADPDALHWHETYDKFRELKLQLGEDADKISYEKFAAKLRKNREDLLARHNCRGVRFVVYEKDGKAAIKASAIR